MGKRKRSWKWQVLKKYWELSQPRISQQKRENVCTDTYKEKMQREKAQTSPIPVTIIASQSVAATREAHLKVGPASHLSGRLLSRRPDKCSMRAEARTHFSSSAAKPTVHDSLGTTHLQEKRILNSKIAGQKTKRSTKIFQIICSSL